MANFGIITHYDVHNHGALLQLTALIKVLAQKGITATALRFDKNYDFLGPELKAKYNVSAGGLRYFLKMLCKRGPGSIVYNFRKRRTLNRFKSTARIVGDYYSESRLLSGVIIGSDEVFALHTGPTPVFFGHALPSNSVVAYAGSFGPTTVADVRRLNCEAFVASGLKSMKGITVRDVNSADAVEQLTGLRPPIVVDPVLLYGFADEIAAMDNPSPRRPYLLVYAYDKRMNDPAETEAIRRYARGKGLEIVSPGFYHKWVDRNVDVDPVGLLGWFRHASEVITDTFHGSVMSIITGTQFATKTRESNYFKLSNLLSEYGLKQRIFADWADLEATMAPEIDYAAVNAEVTRRRAESDVRLDQLLKLCRQ